MAVGSGMAPLAMGGCALVILINVLFDRAAGPGGLALNRTLQVELRVRDSALLQRAEDHLHSRGLKPRLLEIEQKESKDVNRAGQLHKALFAVSAPPDLLPADLVGTQIYNPTTGAFSVHRGPLFANLILADGYGSSETGSHATQRLMPGEDASKGTRFAMDPAVTCVLDENLQPVEPGSGNMGRVARTGRMPLRYYGDPKKTAETFVEVDGVRWAVTGDQATVDTDGTITVLGRGSVSINTGGEKVFPEEVEAALKTHPGVFDTVVVGVPDERWGETVAAVVAPREGTELTLDDLKAHVKGTIAGYKAPRKLVLVDEVVRSPTGKADYPWAKERASSEA